MKPILILLCVSIISLSCRKPCWTCIRLADGAPLEAPSCDIADEALKEFEEDCACKCLQDE